MLSPLRRRADPRSGARPCPPHSLSPNLPNGVCRSQTGRSTPFPAASSALPLPAVPPSSSSTRSPPAPTCADLVRLADCAFRHRMLSPTVLRRQDLASLPSPHSLSPDIPGGICRRQTGAERPLPAALSTLPPAARPPTVTTRLSPQTAWADPRPHAFLPSTTPDAPPLRPAPSGGTSLPPFSVPKHPGAVCFSQVRASAPCAARVTRPAAPGAATVSSRPVHCARDLRCPARQSLSACRIPIAVRSLPPHSVPASPAQRLSPQVGKQPLHHAASPVRLPPAVQPPSVTPKP